MHRPRLTAAPRQQHPAQAQQHSQGADQADLGQQLEHQIVGIAEQAAVDAAIDKLRQ
ncbi:hypothetical protein D3C72_2496260 [compost metagenome]